MSAAVFDAAARTQALGGRRPTYIDGRLLLGLVAALALAAGVALSTGGADVLQAALSLLAFTLCVVAIGRRLTRAVGLNNAAVAAIGREAWSEAAPAFARIATGNFPRGYAALALYNLAFTSLQMGLLDDAVALSAAAVELGPSLGGRGRAMLPLFVAFHALVRAAKGEHEAARALLDEVRGAECAAQVEASLALTGMYVDFKQGRHEAVLAAAREQRAMLFDALTGFQAVLAEALESLAAQRVTGAYRASADGPLALPVGRAQCEVIATLLPEARPLLAPED